MCIEVDSTFFFFSKNAGIAPLAASQQLNFPALGHAVSKVERARKNMTEKAPVTQLSAQNENANHAHVS